MNKIPFFIKHPKSLWFSFIISIFYSLRYSLSSFYSLPIFSSTISRIKSESGSKIIIRNGRLFLGIIDTKIGEVCQCDSDKTIIKLGRNSSLTIEGRVILGPGTRVIIGDNAHVKIGSDTFITGNTQILCSKQINIGSNCSISWGCQIMDTDFHEIIYDNGKSNEINKDVNIGSKVWVGSNVTILKGVCIENNSVIASGSVVTKSFEGNKLIAGNPAKVIRNNIAWKK